MEKRSESFEKIEMATSFILNIDDIKENTDVKLVDAFALNKNWLKYTTAPRTAIKFKLELFNSFTMIFLIVQFDDF